MKWQSLAIPEVILIQPQVFGDHRGFFMETWQRDRYAASGLPEDFVQDNLSASRRGVLRGLHIQHPQGQGKLVQVIQGEVFDVAVDLRQGSPHFGQWAGVTLQGESKQQLYVPPGFGHGYYVLSEMAMFLYKCTEVYHRESEFSVCWNDPDIGIDWPLDGEPLLSDKDRQGSRLRDIPAVRLPLYAAIRED
ncbi:MAG: dTDP-4-dehydrorhamnose 3,5-epimerase [Pseudomonadota bacterium]